MGIYTRTGDGGTAGLPGGKRLAKSEPAFEVLGTVDELNAHLGLCRAACREHDGELPAHLSDVQSDLLELGAQLAAAAGTNQPPAAIPQVARLERQIDAAWSRTPPLRHFILPNGSELACRLHVARTVCRRAERRAAAPEALHWAVPYLNRLSDWLFAMARLANHLAGQSDEVWRKGAAPEDVP
jgi:cob(I)alamin adenosyltransferase